MPRTHLNIVATIDSTIGRMPANVEAERSILGAILLDNRAFNDASEHLRPEDFSLDSHRRIYARMLELAEHSRPIDIITLIEELDRKKDLQAIGDVGYVSSLLDGVPDRPSIEHYVHIVRDKAMLRGLITAANNAIAKASAIRPGRRNPERRRSRRLRALGKAHRQRLHPYQRNHPPFRWH